MAKGNAPLYGRSGIGSTSLWISEGLNAYHLSAPGLRDLNDCRIWPLASAVAPPRRARLSARVSADPAEEVRLEVRFAGARPSQV